MKKHEDNKQQAEELIEETHLNDVSVDYRAGLKDYSAFLVDLKKVWLTGGSEVKSRIIQRLIHRIEIDDNFVSVHYNIDKRNMGLNNNSNATSSGILKKKNFLNYSGSNSLTNGAH